MSILRLVEQHNKMSLAARLKSKFLRTSIITDHYNILPAVSTMQLNRHASSPKSRYLQASSPTTACLLFSFSVTCSQTCCHTGCTTEVKVSAGINHHRPLQHRNTPAVSISSTVMLVQRHWLQDSQRFSGPQSSSTTTTLSTCW